MCVWIVFDTESQNAIGLLVLEVCLLCFYRLIFGHLE
jgi:hypothetical protein